jgi:hypothetical protein
MPTSQKVFTGTGKDGYVTIYKDRHGRPLAKKPGGGLKIPKTNVITNIFDDFDEINITFLIENGEKYVKKTEITIIGKKLKELHFYNPDRRHYMFIDDEIELLITKEQVLLDDCVIISR